MTSEFRTSIGETTFRNKYAQHTNETWAQRAREIVHDVCGPSKERPPLMSKDDCKQLIEYIRTFKFVPGGRYIYYGGRGVSFFNNCFLLKAESDTREAWAEIADRSTSALMSGGGIGVDYSILRPEGCLLKRTGGAASGPLPLMDMVNSIGHNVMQGGSRRSAIWATLDSEHQDIWKFLVAKNWHEQEIIPGLTYAQAKKEDYTTHAPLDYTNISISWNGETADDVIDWKDSLWLANCRQAMSTGEPGFAFNFGPQQFETLRNACTEVTSEDDSDVCNLGSINLAAISDLDEMKDVTTLAAKFLVCGTLRGELPYIKARKIRDQNRRIGLGLMGIHEWLLQRGARYEVTHELRGWLAVYESVSQRSADEHCDRFYLNRPSGYRAIAPTGTIGMLAGTTSGIEPVYSVAYKRRYLTGGTTWKYQYVVDGTAKYIIETLGIDPDKVESAVDLAADYERRIKFQADVQDYVDHAISSTINLPVWGTDDNNEDKVAEFAAVLAEYAPRLRGFTAYPDGSRGGQPIEAVPYREAVDKEGIEYVETHHDICDITGKGGTCGA